MKRIFALMLFTSLAIGLHAQRISAYINSGLMGAQIEGDELKGFDHWNYTGGVGAFAKLTEDGTWGLAIETDYSCRGAFNNKLNTSNPYNIKLDLYYVDIPITLLYRDPYGGLQLGAGLVYGRMVAQPHGRVRFNPNFFAPDSSDMSFLKNDLAAAIEFRFSVWSNLKASIRYQYSIIPIKRDWTFYDKNDSWTRDCYNSALSFRLLWQFGEDDNKSYYSKNKKKKRR
ncbi:MAG: outer membrane beta-barrel protein [Bacteroidales bacterium]|nr:outer membrane beta-barrel protein [Candidatus Colimorpha merdihippi]